MEDIKKHYQLTKILKRNVERIYPNNELKHALVKFHMAKSLKDFQDNYSQALTLFQEADKQLEKIGMQDSKISLQIKFFIGNLYDDLNQSEESIKILNYVLTKQILVYGEDHSLTGRTYNCLGIAEENRSNLKIAREYYQRSYQIFKKIFGGIETIDSAKAMNNLAGIFYKWENYNVCLNLYKKVLEIYKYCLGDNNKFVAITFNNLGNCSIMLGEDDKALVYFTKAVDLSMSIFGVNHHQTATAQKNLGDAYALSGDKKNAEVMYNNCVNTFLQIYGEDNDMYLLTLAKLKKIKDGESVEFI